MASVGAEASRASVATKGTRRKSLTGTRKSSKTSVKSSMEILGPLYTLDLEILGIKNVISKRYPIEVNLSVFYKQKIITSTPSIVIRNPGKYDFNYDFKFRIRKINPATLDQLISEPLLFVLTKLRQGEKNQYSNFTTSSKGRSDRFKNKMDLLLVASAVQKEEEDTDKIDIVKKLVEEEETPLPKVIGECTLDLLPLVEGESVIEEELLLERPVRDLSLPLRLRPLNSRTVLYVRISDRSEMTKNIPPLHNYLMYTVESLYNLNVESLDFNESSVISATIPFPLNVPNKVNEREMVLYNFEPGIVTYNINIDYKKKWYGLANFIRGKGAYSKHRIPIGYKDIKNDAGVDLKKNIENRNARINWNIMRRIYLTAENEEVFMHNLIEYKYLPVEIVVDLSGTVDFNDDQKKKEGSRSSLTSRKLSTSSMRRSRRELETVESEDANYAHFVAFLDVSELLQPGVKSARVAAPVKRFSSGEYSEKWNVTESILQFYLAPMDKDNNIEEDLFIRGKTCFIVVEVSLLHPLVPEKESLGWEKSLQELVTEKPIPILEKLTIPMDRFAQVVKFTIFLIKREMEDFYKLKHSQYSELAFYKEMDFTGHLEHSGAMKMVAETLRKGLVEYIHNVLGAPNENMNTKTYNDYLKITYFKTIDKLYQIIKTLSSPEGDRVEKIIRHDFPNMDELLLYAVEAGEQLNYPKARYYLTKRMELNGYRNPDYWFDYGIMALRFGDMYLALESMKEVIAIYPQHRMGLLAYAILLTVMGEYEEAEKFFYATVKFYPNFWQAWVTFHVFYKLIELSEGADVTFVMGMRYMTECTMNEDWQPHLPLLTWYIDVCDCFDVFLETAKFLLRYNLFEFAEMCLAEYLERENKKDACYYYYLSVCHFIQGRYSDSLKHLEELMAQNETDNYKIWALIGYNYYNLGENLESIRAFNEAIKCLTDYSEIPLILIRLGFDLIEKNCAAKAKEMFLEALKYHSTPLTWIGLGVSCYLLEEIDEAENAFIEANSMDESLAIVWTYLGLILLQRHHLFLYVQCLTEAKKCGLEDKRLFDQLEALQDIYSSSSSQFSEKTESNYSFKCFPKCCDTL